MVAKKKRPRASKSVSTPKAKRAPSRPKKSASPSKQSRGTAKKPLRPSPKKQTPPRSSRPRAKKPPPRPVNAPPTRPRAPKAPKPSARSEAAKKAAATRAAKAVARANVLAAKAEHAAKVRENRRRGALRGWDKRRARATVIEAFNDPRAMAFGLRDVRAEHGRVIATDANGTKRQLYTITNTQNGEVVYRWGDANKLEGYDPDTFEEAYEDVDPDIYEVSFEFDIE
jgi:hypothetical protein